MKQLVLRLIVLAALAQCAAPIEQTDPGQLAPAMPAGVSGDAARPGDPGPSPLAGDPAAVTPAAPRAPVASPLPEPLVLAPTSPIDVATVTELGGGPAVAVAAADRALTRKQAAAALALVAELSWPAAELVKARAFASQGQLDAAEDALARAGSDDVLHDLVSLERGLVAALRLDQAAVVAALLPLVEAGDASLAARAALPLALAASVAAPATLVAHAAAIERALPKTDPDARGLFLEAMATAYGSLGNAELAVARRLERYLEESVSLLTPESPPPEARPTVAMLVGRAEKLLEANRNERAIAAFEALADERLNLALRCRKKFGLGLAHRKEHHYATAESFFTAVTRECAADGVLVRRAMYLNAKVISIADGLRAIPVIETFAKKFAGNSMVDDVLFWAGDLYHRRKLWEQAERYFERIEALPDKGDQCGDARWRLAWMSYRRGDFAAADKRLARLLERDGCVTLKFDRARAHYWRGRIAEGQGDVTRATTSYAAAMRSEPLGYYAQLALKRAVTLAPAEAQALIAALAPPKVAAPPPLCPGSLAERPELARGLALLARGLRSDAALMLTAIEMPARGNRSPSAGGVPAGSTAPPVSCGAHDPQLLLSLLLDRAGVYGAAHWRLRTDFADVLADAPTPESHAIWIAAYPLAYRELVAAAEQESRVPELLLQALCREESALDPAAVSWAGAYGLTQLLLSSAKGAAKLLPSAVTVERGEDLLEPALSARLGGALLGSLVRRYRGNAGLALAGYNASEATADTWWNRHAGESFDVFAEEITIKETRSYVARVLKTWGIYRWMYAGAPPVLPVDASLPTKE